MTNNEIKVGDYVKINLQNPAIEEASIGVVRNISKNIYDIRLNDGVEIFAIKDELEKIILDKDQVMVYSLLAWAEIIMGGEVGGGLTEKL
jgi:hypothetical protein